MLVDVIENQRFIIPEKKYSLVDIGYSNLNYVIIFYWGIRYHSKDQNFVAQKSENAEKLFNLYHSNLCNAVEQIFRVDK